MNFVKTLFTQNPMMIEITRFRRKFFGGNSTPLNLVIVCLAGVIYLGIVSLVWNYRETVEPMMLIIVQTGLFTLLAPAMLYGSIAGERERRSWDFLLVAPVTQGQIICGKFMGAAAAIFATAIAFLIPIGISVIFFQPYEYSSLGGGALVMGSRWRNLGDLVQAELVSVTWALLVCGLTIFFSARCRRAFIALGTTLAFLIATLIVWPILLEGLRLSGLEQEVAYFLHPFWILANIMRPQNAYDDNMVTFGYLHGIPQILLYLALTAIFLTWAERTLRFADNEVKFIPRRKDA